MKEKTKISKQKLLIIISTIILITLAITALATAFLISYNGYSPAKPMILDDGKQIYITCQSNENYQSYRFKFSSEGKDILIDSKTNMISSSFAVEKGVKLGVDYEVSSCYVADREGNNSEYSKPIKWQCSQYLASPVIKFDLEQKLLIWDEIRNADFYKVFINGNDEFINVETSQLDLTTIEGGERVFSVVACSKKNYYKESAVSNEVNIKLVHTLVGFSSINFDLNSKIVVARCTEKYDNVDILLDSTHYIVKKFDIKEEAGFFEYRIDLKLIYSNQKIIGIMPVSKDEYNVADRDTIKYVTVEFPETPEN